MSTANRQCLTPDEFTAIEHEVIILYTAIKAIDNMVNHVFMTFSKNEMGTEVRFKDSPHSELFTSLLTDFITPYKCELSGVQESRLEALLRVSRHPHFNQDNTVLGLLESCDAFNEWLAFSPTFEDVYFAEIGLQANLSMARSFIIKQCGNIAKHNEMTLSRVAGRLQKMMEKNGHSVTMHEAYMMLEDYNEWFQNVIHYHATRITQHLNDIRHAIKVYLQPENESATQWVYDETLGKETPRIVVPDTMETDFSRHCYYYLIQDVRRRAYVDQFTTPSYLTMRH